MTRILAIGDSNTFGVYLTEKESYPARLEILWNSRHPNRTIKVINAGYPGIGSHRLASVIDPIMELVRPDIVLLSIGAADFFSAARYVEPAPERRSVLSRLLRSVRTARKHRKTELYSADTVIIKQREVLRWSEDLEELKPVIKAFKRANNTNPGEPDTGDEFLTLGHQRITMITAEENSEQRDKEKGFHHVQHNLSCMQRKVDAQGATLYMMNYAASSGVFSQANREIRGYARNNPDIHFIDVATGFRELCPDNEQCPDLFFGDLHPTAKACAMVAELVAAELERNTS